MALKFWTFALRAVFTAILSTFTNTTYAQAYGGRATEINATNTTKGSTTATVVTDTVPLLNAGGIRHCGKSLARFQSVNSASEN